jgi:hypothetical protein
MSSNETLKRYGYQVFNKGISRSISRGIQENKVEFIPWHQIKSIWTDVHQNVIYCELWNGGKNFVVTLGDNKEDLMAIYTDLHEKFLLAAGK